MLHWATDNYYWLSDYICRSQSHLVGRKVRLITECTAFRYEHDLKPYYPY